MNLGENIYRYRTAQNQSQTDLADLLDVSRQSVSKWENNTAIPDLDKLIKMSRIFDITLDELVFGTTPVSPKNTPAEPSFILPPVRFIVGITLLIFGMIFFLLSVFWGDHLYFGEAFGELFSAVIPLAGRNQSPRRPVDLCGHLPHLFHHLLRYTQRHQHDELPLYLYCQRDHSGLVYRCRSERDKTALTNPIQSPRKERRHDKHDH